MMSLRLTRMMAALRRALDLTVRAFDAVIAFVVGAAIIAVLIENGADAMLSEPHWSARARCAAARFRPVDRCRLRVVGFRVAAAALPDGDAMMNDATRDRWNRLRVAPLVWLTQAADALATLHRFLRVFFRLSLGLWLILLGCWWWSFLYSAAMYEAEHRLWATFFCPAPKIAVHAVCNVLTVWATARDVLPRVFLIWPSLIALVGGVLLVFAAARAASDNRLTWND